VREGPRIGRYRTSTRDFASDEIAAVKHRLGQVYLDRSGKPAPDDLAADLGKLSRVDWCADCPERPRCTGLVAPAGGEPFAPGEAAVRARIATARGRVLDVGCGEGRYLDLWRPRTAAGVVSYTGLDPDPVRIDHLRRAWPEAELHLLAAEEMAALGRPFDHILLLRSWNHVVDLDRVMAAVAELLAPGGQLVVVDDVPFALARGAAHAARAEAGPARLEHHRNDDAGRALERLRAGPLGGGLVVVERRDVTPSSGPEWLLVLRRAGPPAA
jgi:SAM-dependent methyltransferase